MPDARGMRLGLSFGGWRIGSLAKALERACILKERAGPQLTRRMTYPRW